MASQNIDFPKQLSRFLSGRKFTFSSSIKWFRIVTPKSSEEPKYIIYVIDGKNLHIYSGQWQEYLRTDDIVDVISFFEERLDEKVIYTKSRTFEGEGGQTKRVTRRSINLREVFNETMTKGINME